MKNGLKSLIYIGLAVVSTLPNIVSAANLKDAFGIKLEETGGSGGYNIESRSIEGLNQNVITTVISFSGVIFIILIIYAGTTWMTAHGNEEKIEQAKKTIKGAMIGIVLTLAAYIIAWTVINLLMDPGLPN